MSTTVARSQPSLTHLMMPTAEEIARGRRRLHVNAAFIALLGVGSYTALVFAPVGFPLRVVFALVLVVASLAAATSIMHDGNHGAFSTSGRINRIAGWTSDLLGASSFLWRFKHNKLHHLNTNIVGYDTDIDQAPFARLAPQGVATMAPLPAPLHVGALRVPDAAVVRAVRFLRPVPRQHRLAPVAGRATEA